MVGCERQWFIRMGQRGVYHPIGGLREYFIGAYPTIAYRCPGPASLCPATHLYAAAAVAQHNAIQYYSSGRAAHPDRNGSPRPDYRLTVDW